MGFENFFFIFLYYPPPSHYSLPMDSASDHASWLQGGQEKRERRDEGIDGDWMWGDGTGRREKRGKKRGRGGGRSGRGKKAKMGREKSKNEGADRIRGVGGGRGETNWEREGHEKRGKFCARTLRGREGEERGGRRRGLPPVHPSKMKRGGRIEEGANFFTCAKHTPLWEGRRKTRGGRGGGRRGDSLHYSPPLTLMVIRRTDLVTATCCIQEWRDVVRGWLIPL